MPVREIKLNPLTLYGITKGCIQINLGQFKMIDVSKREETIKSILEGSVASEWSQFSNTIFRTEDFMLFRVE